jgi:hypothetical protein
VVKPFKLVNKIKGDGHPTGGGIGGTRPGVTSQGGVVIDGVVYPLEGEPPVAVSKGWGDMGWTRFRR